MTIELDLNMHPIKHDFQMENTFGIKRNCNSFQIQYSKGKRIYLSAQIDGINHFTFYKTMKFEDNGDVTIGFGKDRIKLGTYKAS